MKRKMFRNRRLVIAVCVILLGAGASAWILGAKSGKTTAALFEIIEAGTNAVRFAALGDAAPDSGITADSFLPENSVTKRIFDRYREEVFKANEWGAGTTTPITIPNELMLAKIVSEEVTQALPVPAFARKDIRIAKENSLESALAYVQNIDRLYKQHFQGTDEFLPVIYAAASDPDRYEEVLRSYISINSDHIAALLAVPAPLALTDFHIQLLNAFKKREAISNAILDGATDPMKPLAAIEMLETALAEEEQLANVLETALRDISA